MLSTLSNRVCIDIDLYLCWYQSLFDIWPTLVGTASDIKYHHWISSAVRFDVKYDIQSGVV